MVDLKGQFSVQMNSLEMNAKLNWIKLCSFQSTAVSVVYRRLDFTALQAKIVGQTVTFGASETVWISNNFYWDLSLLVCVETPVNDEWTKIIDSEEHLDVWMLL